MTSLRNTSEKISHVELDEKAFALWDPDLAHDRDVAIFDLLEDNWIKPEAIENGPFELLIKKNNDLIVFEFFTSGRTSKVEISMPLYRLWRIVKPYFSSCNDYFHSISHATAKQIECLDRQRRELHDEGASQLMSYFQEQVAMDPPTARNLFTLVCALIRRD